MKDRNGAPSTKPAKVTKKSTASVILGAVSAIFIAITALGLWAFRDYIADPALLRDRIGDHYFIGAVLTVLISAVQVIVALLPGEFVEIAAGYIFGSWMGSLLCLAGIVLGSCTAILLVRRFGRRFVYAIYPKERLENLPILRNPAKRNLLTVVLFAIPGTPKDLFTYFVGLTRLKLHEFLVVTLLARIPSVVSSTIGGTLIQKQDYIAAVLLFLVTGAVSLGGLVLYNRLRERKNKPKS